MMIAVRPSPCLKMSSGRRRSVTCMAGQWLEGKASIDVPVPIDHVWKLWDNRTEIPKWMPWIHAVEVQDSDPRLSKWRLVTRQFGRDWEFSWLARNLAPVKGQKIHWVSEPGSTSLGIEVANRGQIRFIKKNPSLTNVTLSITYEVPTPLVPFANLLTPVLEDVLSKDMGRFRDYAVQTNQK